MINDHRAEFPVLKHEEIWQGHVFGIDSDQVELESGAQPVTRDYVNHPGAVAIVALRNSDVGRPEVLLIRQYRHPVRANLWEVPAGLLDIKNEDPLVAARRELMEEADLEAKQWDVLVDYFCSPGGSNESLRIFLARDLSEVASTERFIREDEEKLIKPVWVDLAEAVAAIHEGRLHNPSAVTGILATQSALYQEGSCLRPTNAKWFR